MVALEGMPSISARKRLVFGQLVETESGVEPILRLLREGGQPNKQAQLRQEPERLNSLGKQKNQYSSMAGTFKTRFTFFESSGQNFGLRLDLTVLFSSH